MDSSFDCEGFSRRHTNFPPISNEVIVISSDDESERIDFEEESIEAFTIDKNDVQFQEPKCVDEDPEFDFVDASSDIDEKLSSTSDANSDCTDRVMALNENYFATSPDQGPVKILYTTEFVGGTKDEELKSDYSCFDENSDFSYKNSIVTQIEKYWPSFDDTKSESKEISLHNDAQESSPSIIHSPKYLTASNPSTPSPVLIIDDEEDCHNVDLIQGLNSFLGNCACI